MDNMKKNKKGFTLVELLAVIVVLGIVLTIAATILELVTSIRLENYTFDYRGLGIVWTSVAAWAICTEEKEKSRKI